jgi:hypothetical protein
MRRLVSLVFSHTTLARLFLPGSFAADGPSRRPSLHPDISASGFPFSGARTKIVR